MKYYALTVLNKDAPGDYLVEACSIFALRIRISIEQFMHIGIHDLNIHIQFHIFLEQFYIYVKYTKCYKQINVEFRIPN